MTLMDLHDPSRLPRTVVGIALNDARDFDRLTPDIVQAAPYKGAPRTPVLYLKPANTYAGDGDTIVLPDGADTLVVGACVGVIIGRRASRLSPDNALESVAGYRACIDLFLPHDSYYRPAIKQRCRDGFFPMAHHGVDAAAIQDPDQLEMEIELDGKPALSTRTSHFIRPVAELLARVTEFMTLEPGDMVLTGLPADAPLARAGQTVAVRIPDVGQLTVRLAACPPFSADFDEAPA